MLGHVGQMGRLGHVGQMQPPLRALRFSHGRGERETRVTGDEPQGTMGRVQTAGEARLARCLLPAHIFIKRQTSGYEAGSDGSCGSDGSSGSFGSDGSFG